MSRRRVITKKERIKRAEQRKKMLQTFYLCFFISVIIALIYIMIYIPMAVNFQDLFLNPLGEFYFGTDSFFRGLVLARLGLITLADVLTAILITCFFAFLFIGIANLTEYNKRIASYLEMIITIAGTLCLTILYGFAAGSATMTALTAIGCVFTIVYLYAVQT